MKIGYDDWMGEGECIYTLYNHIRSILYGLVVNLII